MARFQKARSNTYSCSFCGKSQQQVARLIAGPNVFICNECVAICQEILEEEHIAPPPPAPNHPPAAPPSE